MDFRVRIIYNKTKKGLIKSSKKISDEKYKNDYMNTDIHKYMLNNKAIPYIDSTKKEQVKPKKIVKKKIPGSFKPGVSICPQFGIYFNFCPNCAYNNTKNDFKFCPDCGTSLEKR